MLTRTVIRLKLLSFLLLVGSTICPVLGHCALPAPSPVERIKPTPTPKGPTHLECVFDKTSGGLCKEVAGEGPSQCSNDAECRHLGCGSNGYVSGCVPVFGPGPNECTGELNDDCWHAGCWEFQCIPLWGEGTDLCTEDADCNYLPPVAQASPKPSPAL